MRGDFTEQEVAHILNVKEKIRDAVNDFKLTVEKLGTTCANGWYVSGGCTATLLQQSTFIGDPWATSQKLPDPVKDYDIFFMSANAAQPVLDLFLTDPAYMNNVAECTQGYRDLKVGDKLITENAVTLKNGLQLITKHYDDPDGMRRTFDFVHCMPWYDPYVDKIGRAHV